MDERILKYFQNELDAAERLELLREIRKDDILKKQFSEYQNLCALINLSSYGENIDEGSKKIYFKSNARIRIENPDMKTYDYIQGVPRRGNEDPQVSIKFGWRHILVSFIMIQ